VVATVDGASPPLTSSNGFPPGHLVSEGIDPGLQSFQSMSSGKLAGNISAASLAAALIPVELAGGGLSACSQNYTMANTWLDLLVGGCTVFFVQQIAPTQPDQADPGAPVAGAGAPYTFTRTGNSVTGCRDKNAAAVSLPACLNAAAYSVYFQFASDRVIVRVPDSDGDGCADEKELLLVPPTDPNDPWDFYSVPAPALFSAADPLVVAKDGVVSGADAQAVFAYAKKGAKVGTLEYEQDRNASGVKDGIEYDRSFVGPGHSGAPDGVISGTDAQLAFVQAKLGYHC
jgi:hypothetical protein